MNTFITSVGQVLFDAYKCDAYDPFSLTDRAKGVPKQMESYNLNVIIHKQISWEVGEENRV